MACARSTLAVADRDAGALSPVVMAAAGTPSRSVAAIMVLGPEVAVVVVVAGATVKVAVEAIMAVAEGRGAATPGDGAVAEKLVYQTGKPARACLLSSDAGSGEQAGLEQRSRCCVWLVGPKCI